MKIREGFVSNSSSSSFIVVALPKGYKPSKKELDRAYIAHLECGDDKYPEDRKEFDKTLLKKLGDLGDFCSEDDILVALLKDCIVFTYTVEDGGGDSGGGIEIMDIERIKMAEKALKKYREYEQQTENRK